METEMQKLRRRMNWCEAELAWWGRLKTKVIVAVCFLALAASAAPSCYYGYIAYCS